MIWLATFSLVEFWNKIIESFPSELSETNWWDWLWFVVFLFLGSPLTLEIVKPKEKGCKEVIGILALTVVFFGGWSMVGYFTR